MIPLLVAPLRLCLYAICQEVSKEVRVDKSEEDSRQSAMPFELNIPEYSSYEFCTPLPGPLPTRQAEYRGHPKESESAERWIVWKTLGQKGEHIHIETV